MLQEGRNSELDSEMSEHTAILEANRQYTESFGSKGALSLPPARRIAILTRLDPRPHPPASASFRAGDSNFTSTEGGPARNNYIRLLVYSFTPPRTLGR